MAETNETSELRFIGMRLLVSIAAFFVVVAGLKAGANLLVPFLFALFLAILGVAPLSYLQDRKVPKAFAVLLITLFYVALFLVIAVLLKESVQEFSGELPFYRSRLEELTILLLNSRFVLWLQELGIEVSTSEAFNLIAPASLMELVGKMLNWGVSTISKLFFILIMIVFMLLEAADFRYKVKAAFGHNVDTTRFEDITGDVQKYLVIKTITSGLTGLLIFFWTMIMGVEFEVLWGMTAFFLNYIPFIGSFIAAVPAVLLALIESGFTGFVVVGIGYVVINIGVSNFLEPVLFGKRLGLSVLVVFLSLAFWGWVWGPAGALMSVPLTMIVKILLEHSEDFSWVSVMLGARPPKSDG